MNQILKGIVNNSGEKDGVKGQYIGFVTSLQSNGNIGDRTPNNSVKTKYSITYSYRKAGTSSFTNIATIDPSNPIYNTVLYSYGRPFEPTTGFWPDDDWFKASGTSSGSWGITIYDSGTMTASMPSQSNVISSENTNFYSYSTYDDSTIVTQGYELFVPFYEPTQGEKYDYRIIIKPTSVIYDDDTATEYIPDNESIIYNYSNYLTGNLKSINLVGEYSVYGENTNYTSSASDTFSDIDPLPIDKRRGFTSSVSADEGPYEGGLERLIVWNSEAVDLATYKLPTITYSNGGIFPTPSVSDAVIKYGEDINSEQFSGSSYAALLIDNDDRDTSNGEEFLDDLHKMMFQMDI